MLSSRTLLSYFILLIFNLFFQQVLTAQQNKSINTYFNQIEGLVYDGETGEPIEFAIIRIFQGKDTVFKFGGITDANGKFLFSNLSDGLFTVKISSVGYREHSVNNIILNDKYRTHKCGRVNIFSSSVDLKSVEVVAEDESEKSTYQIDVDKKIYTVSKDIVSTNGTAGDVLQNIPSVFVTQDGDVSLRGGNVKIFINGRPSGLMGISRDQILDYIPASMIEKIEVITNPSSRYDAEGGAGIINIILKKQKKPGFNGFLIANVGTLDKYNSSVNLNFNQGKINIFGSYDIKSYNIANTEIKNRTSRPLGKLKYTDQDRNWFRKNLSQNERINIEYRINDKNTIAASVLNTRFTGNDNGILRYNQLDSLRDPTSIYNREINEIDKDYSTDYTLNYTKKFKKSQQLLTSDFSYSTSKEITSGDIKQNFFNLNNTPSTKLPAIINTYNINLQDNFIWQLDYTHPITKKDKLEIGLKSRNRNTNSTYQLDNFIYPFNAFIRDDSISNSISFKEQVNAAYVAYKKKIKKIGFKFGLRAEHTVTDFIQVENFSEVKRNYFNLFPSTHWSWELKKENNITFSYAKRIDRPSLSQINSLQKYNDPQFLFRGNPNILPELVHSFDISHIKNWKKNSFSSSVYYRTGKNDMQRITTLDSNGVTLTTYRNLKSTKNVGAEFYAYLFFHKKFRISSSFNVYRKIIDATNLGSAYFSDRYTWNSKVNLNFILWKNANFQFTANYQAPTYTPWTNNYNQFFADFAFRQDLWKKKVSFSIRCSDIFWSQRRITETFDYNYSIYNKYRKESRIVFFSITIRPFGLSKKMKEPAKDNDIINDDRDPDKQ